MLRARDLMTEAPATVRPTSTVRSAVEILQALDVRHLPVVNEDGELVGMISDRDLRALSIPTLVGDEYVGDLRTALEASVSSIMSTGVISVEAESAVAEIVDLLLDNRIGAVPVTDEEGVLIGIVSYVDILRRLPVDSAAE